MWLRLGRTKNKSSPTWRQEENELKSVWVRNDTGQGITWRQKKRKEISPQRVDKEKRKRDSQVLSRYSPWMIDGMA